MFFFFLISENSDVNAIHTQKVPNTSEKVFRKLGEWVEFCVCVHELVCSIRSVKEMACVF